MQASLVKYWYQKSLTLPTLLLLPLSWLFRFCICIRRTFYRIGIFKIHRFPVPVIIVGNITLGGTGKTPCVIWLAQYLKDIGFVPGIITRGVGGVKHLAPYCVNNHSSTLEVGDEALLLYERTASPVIVCRNKVAAVKYLLQNTNCDIVICDDGLQHYRLARDVEIAIIDSERLFGNAQLLPAGPLREPISRLRQVDFVIVNGGTTPSRKLTSTRSYNMTFVPADFVCLQDPTRRISLNDLKSQKVHAIAGIGHPQRFFSMLEKLSIAIIPHVFPDHYNYQATDLMFPDAYPIVMTEKDAVKCRTFCDDRYWYLPITAEIEAGFAEQLHAHPALQK